MSNIVITEDRVRQVMQVLAANQPAAPRSPRRVGMPVAASIEALRAAGVPLAFTAYGETLAVPDTLADREEVSSAHRAAYNRALTKAGYRDSLGKNPTLETLTRAHHAMWVRTQDAPGIEEAGRQGARQAQAKAEAAHPEPENPAGVARVRGLVFAHAASEETLDSEGVGFDGDYFCPALEPAPDLPTDAIRWCPGHAEALATLGIDPARYTAFQEIQRLREVTGA